MADIDMEYLKDVAASATVAFIENGRYSARDCAETGFLVGQCLAGLIAAEEAEEATTASEFRFKVMVGQLAEVLAVMPVDRLSVLDRALRDEGDGPADFRNLAKAILANYVTTSLESLWEGGDLDRKCSRATAKRLGFTELFEYMGGDT